MVQFTRVTSHKCLPRASLADQPGKDGLTAGVDLCLLPALPSLPQFAEGKDIHHTTATLPDGGWGKVPKGRMQKGGKGSWGEVMGRCGGRAGGKSRRAGKGIGGRKGSEVRRAWDGIGDEEGGLEAGKVGEKTRKTTTTATGLGSLKYECLLHPDSCFTVCDLPIDFYFPLYFLLLLPFFPFSFTHFPSSSLLPTFHCTLL